MATSTRQKAATANKPKAPTGPEGALDVDGTNCETFIDKSVKASGLTRDEWFKKFNQAAANTKHPANVTDAASLKSYLDGIYGANDNYGTAKGNGVYGTMTKIQEANSTYTRNSKGKSVLVTSFFYDPAWQYRSSMQYQPSRTLVPEYTKEELEAHRKDGSWVVVKKGKGKKATTEVFQIPPVIYVDPSKLNLIARPPGEGRLGDIYKVTDASDPTKYTYAMLFDRSNADESTSITEVSEPVFGILGKTADPAKGTNARLNQQRLGPSDLYERFKKTGVLPTQQDIKEAGERLDPKALKPLPKTANTGDYQFPEGDDTILLGPQQLPAVFKGSMHTGGGVIAQASQTTFYGKARNPAARVEDPTSDGYDVFTGDDTIEIG